MPAGVGGLLFGGMESRIAGMLYAIPGVKGVEFGRGFALAEMRGSEANDPIRLKNGRITMASNNAGGINGGITNGMPLVVRMALRPTPSIACEQPSVDLATMEETPLRINGRHDPCLARGRSRSWRPRSPAACSTPCSTPPPRSEKGVPHGRKQDPGSAGPRYGRAGNRKHRSNHPAGNRSGPGSHGRSGRSRTPAQKAGHGTRWHHALWRGVAGLLAAIVLLAASGFGVFRLGRGAQEIAGTFDADPGTFVQHDIVFILNTFSDPNGGSAQYGVVPIGGKLVAFRFPARWDASVKTIADATTSVLSGQSYSVDSFIRVTGTVKTMPEDVSSALYDWYTENNAYLQQIGAIGDSDDAADYLPDAIVCVDTVGSIPQGWVEG